jgi:hypothetical protein
MIAAPFIISVRRSSLFANSNQRMRKSLTFHKQVSKSRDRITFRIAFKAFRLPGPRMIQFSAVYRHIHARLRIALA